MIKYIKKKLSVKIFLLTTLLLMGIAAVTYGFVAEFMPLTYTEALNKNLENRAKNLADSLSGYTLNHAYKLLTDFSEQYQSSLILIDDKGEVVYEESWPIVSAEINSAETADVSESAIPEETIESLTVQGTASEDIAYTQKDTEASFDEAVVAESPPEVTVTEDTSQMTATVEELEERAMGRFPVAFKNSSTEYTLFVFGSTEQVNQAVQALKRILPWLLLTIFAVSVLVSLFYSWYLTRPVVRLSRISRRMAELDFEVRSRESREDEIGILSDSLDTLSDSLDTALTELRSANDQLKSDMEKEREQEHRRMEFFAAASHELKTPVTILKGQIDGMLQGVGSYKDRDYYLGRARKVTETLETMVHEILMISRMESRGFSVQKKDTDLAELIRVQLADLNDLFEEKKMQMKIHLPSSLIWKADPAMMTTVVRNLLVNAVRYSPQQAQIYVGLYQEKGEAVVRVENSGVWVPEADLGKIFDAFYRVDASRNRKSGGSGLGLYIVREILEQHQASCCMENTAGGVQVTFRLPGKSSTQNTQN